MRLARFSKIFTAVGTVTLLLLSSAAFAQMMLSPAERRLERSSDPDVYYLFNDDKKQIIDYKKDHIIRVCVTENPHLVPLTVVYDDQRANIAPGDCMRLEAQEVSLQPSKTLEDNWMMRAEVETIS